MLPRSCPGEEYGTTIPSLDKGVGLKVTRATMEVCSKRTQARILKKLAVRRATPRIRPRTPVGGSVLEGAQVHAAALAVAQV